MLPINLAGHHALVTGGSGELGRVIARTLAQAGADVTISYRSQKTKATATLESVRAFGVRGEAFECDVTDPASVRDLGAVVGSPDIVVANAVVQYQWKPILEQPLEDFRSQYESCVEHLVSLAKVFAPTMIEKGWGRFVAINTECAIQCGAGMGAYSSAKRGMDGIVRVLARELGPNGITVNEVAPGWMRSDSIRSQKEDPQKEYHSRVPLRGSGDDTDIGNAVAFLASNLARFITGTYLPVCGGNVMVAI